MNTKESFSNSIYDEEIQRAEHELAAFISAVTELFGAEEARLSAEEWLDESELMDSPPRSTSRDWRAVTIAASARLACRLDVALHHQMTFGTSTTDTKVSPIPSSNCFASSFCCHAPIAADSIGMRDKKSLEKEPIMTFEKIQSTSKAGDDSTIQQARQRRTLRGLGAAGTVF